MIEEIIRALEPELGEVKGVPVPLEGGITNRNFKVRLGDRDYVIRVPGKRTDELGIDREAERRAAECAAALGVAPAVAAKLDSPSCLVTAFVQGEQMTEATTAIRPMMLNQPVYQAHLGPPSLPANQ